MSKKNLFRAYVTICFVVVKMLNIIKRVTEKFREIYKIELLNLFLLFANMVKSRQ